MSYRLIALAAAAITLQGCATKAPVVAGEDFNDGIAKTCNATALGLPATASATITMTNDGWCAVRTKESDGKPYALGLLQTRPEHGRVLVQQLGGETRLEYTADAGYTGEDKFSVALRSRNTSTPDAAVQVVVMVTRGEGVPAVAAPAAPAAAPARTTTRPAARPAARTPARSSSTRTPSR